MRLRKPYFCFVMIIVLVSIWVLPSAATSFQSINLGVSGDAPKEAVKASVEKADSGSENKPPFQPELKKSPAGPVADDNDLVVSVTGPKSADPNGDKVHYEYKWFVKVNGVFVEDKSADKSSHTGDKVPAADTKVGEIWKVQVTPVDEHGSKGQSSEATWDEVKKLVAYNKTVTTDVYNPAEVVFDAHSSENKALTYSIVKKPSSGTLGEIKSNKVTYTPKNNFVGTDSFTYIAKDGKMESNEATVTVAVYERLAFIQFDNAKYSVSENVYGGKAEIRAIRYGDTNSVVEAVYSSVYDTAKEGVDFKNVNGTIKFDKGETAKTFYVPIIDDSIYEGNETIKLSLSKPTGNAHLGTVKDAVLTIVDNESSSDDDDDDSNNTDNAPTGDLIGRMNDRITLGKAVKIDQEKEEIVIDYDTKLLQGKPNHTPRVYYWNDKYKNWIALASYTQGNDKVKADNTEKYKGWFCVFGVVQPSFSDINTSYWAEAAINRMNGLGMIEGYEDRNPYDLIRTARPERDVTRAEFTMFLFRIMNIDPDKHLLPDLTKQEAYNKLNGKFNDVNKIPDWVLKEAAAVADADLISGRDGKFDPNTSITRIEAATMISRALKKMPGYKPADLKKFKDASNVPEWAKAALAEDVLSGYPDGKLKPNDRISRAESVTVLLRLFVNGMGW